MAEKEEQMAEEAEEQKVEEAEEKKSEFEPSTMDSGGERSDWWDRFSTKLTGPLTSSKDPKYSESVFKISRNVFNYICSLVKDDLAPGERQKSSSGDHGNAFSVEDQVAIALRRLISGETLDKVGWSFGIKLRKNVRRVILRFVESMEKRAINHLLWPNFVQMRRIKSKFQAICGLPNCCGAIASTRIDMRLPWTEKDHHRMILQAVVDPYFRFRDVFICSTGDLNETAVLEGSPLFKLCENGTQLSRVPVKFSEEAEAAVREYIVGGEAYPLRPWLFTPYKGKYLADHELGFNNRLCAAVTVAEKTLSSLKETFKYLKGELWPDKEGSQPRIILVCFLIHNIIKDLEDSSECTDEEQEEDEEDGGMLRDKLAKCLRRK